MIEAFLSQIDFNKLATFAGSVVNVVLHGLIITPEHGARVRLAVVFTNIENLPFNTEFPHNWIGEFCQTCKRCAKTCPGQAMYDEPLVPNDEIITYVDQEKCFPYFLRDHGSRSRKPETN